MAVVAARARSAIGAAAVSIPAVSRLPVSWENGAPWFIDPGVAHGFGLTAPHPSSLSNYG